MARAIYSTVFWGLKNTNFAYQKSPVPGVILEPENAKSPMLVHVLRVFHRYKQNLWKLFFMSHRGYRKRTSPMFMRCNIAILTPKIITLYECAGLFALKTRFSQAGRGKCLCVKFYTHVQKSMFFVKPVFRFEGNFAIGGVLRASKLPRYLVLAGSLTSAAPEFRPTGFRQYPFWPNSHEPLSKGRYPWSG
jgi:hypothetical protein